MGSRSTAKVQIPDGNAVQISSDGKVVAGDQPIIPFIEGDGVGPDIWRASVRVFDRAIAKTYGGKRKVAWCEVYAGERANALYGEGTWLPEETLDAIRKFRVAIKGPLTTPIGGGIRSINVALRQALDLYACVRPVRWFRGVEAPVKDPASVDMVIFRENIEDVYAGIEWPAKSAEAERVIAMINQMSKTPVPTGSAIGIKPMSEARSKRLIRRAIRYALERKRPSVTIVHKGNIQKYTEGAFRTWGYEVATQEFRSEIVTEEEIGRDHRGNPPPWKLVIKDRLADNFFQQILIRPSEYHVVATPNLNGDYISDALAAQVGGLGIAPGANIGDEYALFEATHGTAPKYAGQDKVNPSSLILSGLMMFEFLGWIEVTEVITRALEQTLGAKKMTYDLARSVSNATELKTSQFADAVIQAI